jgi:predicted MPP superfamily phosphohydrolase
MFGTVGLINSTSNLGNIIFKIASIGMGVFLFLIISFLISDFINLFYKLKPSSFGLISFSLTILLSLYSYYIAHHTVVTEYNLTIRKLNNNIKAVHWSDVHIGHYRTGKYLENLVLSTNKLKADVIFITGDFLDSKFALDKKYFSPLKKLNAPVYFVDGNHDHATGNNRIYQFMQNAGVNVLNNKIAEYNDLQIIGLSHMIADRESFDMHASPYKPTIQECLDSLQIDRSKASVILHHSPNGLKYANEKSVDLFLTGHTHAGQIFPFNFAAHFMFDYNRGLYNTGKTKLIVSEGIGTFGPPFRLGTKSEIIVLNLQAGKNN